MTTVTDTNEGTGTSYTTQTEGSTPKNVYKKQSSLKKLKKLEQKDIEFEFKAFSFL